MGELEERIKKLEYHQKLILEMIHSSEFPAYEMIIKKDLSEEEVQQVFGLCEDLIVQYEQEKEEGFVYFTPLLTQFVNLLNDKLDPEETIDAFLCQGMYRPLMDVLKKTLTIIQK